MQAHSINFCLFSFSPQHYLLTSLVLSQICHICRTVAEIICPDKYLSNLGLSVSHETQVCCRMSSKWRECWNPRSQAVEAKKGEFQHGAGLAYCAPGHSTPLSPWGGGDIARCMQSKDSGTVVEHFIEVECCGFYYEIVSIIRFDLRGWSNSIIGGEF